MGYKKGGFSVPACQIMLIDIVVVKVIMDYSPSSHQLAETAAEVDAGSVFGQSQKRHGLQLQKTFASAPTFVHEI